MIAPLSHCSDCGLWLRPDQGCLHMPAMPLKGRFDLSQGDRDCGRPAVFGRRR